MNGPARLVVALACVACAAFAIFLFEVFIFRAACRLAGIPKPSVPRSISIVVVGFMVGNAVEAALGAIVREIYIATDYPLWEAGIVAFFLILPVHMIASSFVHARMMNIAFTDGIAEWVVEKALKLAILIVTAVTIFLIVLLGAVLR